VNVQLHAPGQNSLSVWFNDVGISAFHSYVVVDLWQSLSEYPLDRRLGEPQIRSERRGRETIFDPTGT
jgi:hypothetical protein